MRNTYLFITSVLLISTISFAGAEQALDQDQILNIFKSLNNQTRESWISSGSIEGTHINVDIDANEIITTIEKIKYDGERFHWAINMKSHEDINQKPIRNQDAQLNKKRIFSWNGHEYTMYFKSSHNVIVYEDNSDVPVNVNGPLKAGLVPWGYGIYKIDELAKNFISAKFNADGKIVMQFNKSTEYSLELKLDPAKDYAVLSQNLEWNGKSSFSATCSDYAKYGKHWIPSTIIANRTQYTSGANPKQYDDLWQITSVDITPPAEDEFITDYDDNTRVKFHTMNKVLSYRYKTGRKTEYMLQHRKYNGVISNRNDRNCATAALLYIASIFGKDVSTADLDGFVTGTDRSTSLFQMQEFFKSKELSCMAVKSDLIKLSDLQNCRAILYLPKAKHYVILDHIDSKYAWVIDLDSDKFYYRLPLYQLKEQWKDRTAMIISDKPITAPTDSTYIPEDMLHQIKGSTGGFGTYSCTDLIQAEGFKSCSQISGLCGGTSITWYDVYGCELNEDGTYCSGEDVLSCVSELCINDTSGGCTVAGDWKSYYMHGCN